jgi:tRNA modification GTPase
LDDPGTTAEQLADAADGLATVDRLLNPPEIVLAGLPNAGKSTLMNHLVGRPVSIVHAQAGTTRDWVREKALFFGVPVWLTDTAGLWADADHPVDVESVRRAWQQIEQADVVILLSDDGCFELPGELHHPVILRARSKCDQASSDDPLAISAQTGAGIDALQRAVLEAVGLANIDPRLPRAITKAQATALLLR